MTPYQGFPWQWLMQIPSSEISLEIMIVPNIFTESNSRIQIFGWGTIVGMSHDLPSNCETGVSRIWPKFHVENCGAGLVSSAFNERNEDRWGGFSLHCVKENKKWQGETVTLHSITLNLIECIESGRSKLDFNQKTDHSMLGLLGRQFATPSYTLEECHINHWIFWWYETDASIIFYHSTLCLF